MNWISGAAGAGMATLLSVLMARWAAAAAGKERWERLLGSPTRPRRGWVSSLSNVLRKSEAQPDGRIVSRGSTPGGVALERLSGTPAGRVGLALVLGSVGWTVGSGLAPPLGGPAGALALAMVPRAIARRGERKRSEAVERQLADLAESSSQALRSGLSTSQSLEFALSEAQSPLRGLLDRALSRQALGVPVDDALRGFGDLVGTDDARLLVMVFGIHARSGGDLPGALDEVGRTIRHRIGVRRELRVLSAQGRVSGAILGSLPIVFFLVMSVTSRRDLDPVLRSPAGIVMIGLGLALQALAYLWIRRLLRVAV